MHEEEIHLRDYLRVVKRRRWWIFLTMFAVVAVVTVVSFKRTPVYRAIARIIIEKDAPNILSFKEVMDLDMTDQDYYQTQAKILKSRSLAEGVIQELNLAEQLAQQPQTSISVSIRQFIQDMYLKAQKWLGAPETPKSETVKTAEKEEAIIRRFLGGITITPIRSSRLLDVSVDATDQIQAARIANTLVETYIQQYLDTKLAASKDAVSWLVDELEEAKKKVTDSEAALQKYKEDYAILSLKGRQNIVMQKLAELNTAVNQAKFRRMAFEAQYEQIQSFQKRGLQTIPRVLDNPLIQKLKLELSALESEHLELLRMFREKHPTVIALKSQIMGVRNQLMAEVRQVLASINNEYDLAQVQENDLLEALEQQKAEVQALNQKSIEYGVLEREVESNRRIYDALLQRTKEASLTERLETSNIRIVEAASIPTLPIAPRKARNILLAIVIGLVIGVTLAFFLEYLDDSIRTPQDLKLYLEIPFLGMIPKVSAKQVVSHEKKKPALAVVAATITVLDAQSNISEAYRGLRTNVTLSALEQGMVLLITSASPSEGKSSVTANLGIAMAQSGRKTLIIDCDFRRPMMGQIFCLENPENGFTDILARSETDNGDGLGNVIQATEVENLSVILCGTTPSNPSELLGLEKTGRIIRTLGERYENILIDSPPVNAVTDPVVLSQVVQGVVFVVRAGETKRDVARYARDQLHEAKAVILGGVLNSVNLQKDGYYYYAYRDSSYYRKKT